MVRPAHIAILGACCALVVPGPALAAGAQVILTAPALTPSEIGWSAGGVTVRAALATAVTWQAVVSDACGTTRRVLGDAANAGTLEFTWDGRDDTGAPPPPGDYTVALRTLTGDGRQDLTALPVRISPTPGAPADPCAVPPVAPESFTLIGAGWGHGVGMSQYGALGQAREGRTSAEILAYYYPTTALVPLPVNQPLRVSLADSAPGVVLRGEPAADGGGTVSVVLDGGAEVLLPPGEIARIIPAEGRLRMTRGGAEGQDAVVGEAAAVLIRWSGTADPAGSGGVPGVLNLVSTASSAAGLRTGGHRYRYGTVSLAANAGGVRVVTTLRLGDEYLLGIGEIPSTWPEAALQAQVVAARSFALARYGNGRVRPACDCHVSATTADQNFVGWSKETGADGQRWRAAVLAMMTGPDEGLVLTHGGQPIAAYYSSSTGGRTQRAQDAWGGPIAWAPSVADRWSLESSNPHSDWRVSVPQARVAALLGLPDVARLAITSRHISGAVARVTGVATSGATASITGEQLRTGLGLRSRYISSVLPVGQPIGRYAAPHGTGMPGAPGAAGAPAPGTPAPAAPSTPAPAAPSTPAPGAAQPTGSAPVGRTITVRLRTPQALVRVGDRVEFRGTVTGVPGRARVSRQLRSGGTWRTVETIRARTDGRYRMTVRMPAGGRYRYRIAVVDPQGQVRLISEPIRVQVASDRTATMEP
ncbi:MAG: hypothetical protein KGP10_01865 [Actinomycetales bacterium]|nr:hypothetical protein [Actinomycetales bacterium]